MYIVLQAGAARNDFINKVPLILREETDILYTKLAGKPASGMLRYLLKPVRRQELEMALERGNHGHGLKGFILL